MHFLSEYGLFLLKIITIVIAILVVIGGGVLIIALAKHKEKAGKLTIQKINKKYQHYREIIDGAAGNRHERKLTKKNLKQLAKMEKVPRPRLFILNFAGDVKASAVESLREEITAIIISRKPDDQVLLCLESPGGLVHAYGLAAAQIQRLKQESIKVTIAVDKVAASGGYMMACLADHIIAAPFAIIGSIGVIAQLPNFHRWLEKNEIDFEQISAGQYKRTLTLFGRNTPEGRQKLQEEINDAHHLFKLFIQQNRPAVNIDEVATGEHWFACRALDLKLIDDIKTSDDFIIGMKTSHDIYQLKYEFKKNLGQRLAISASGLVNHFWPPNMSY